MSHAAIMMQEEEQESAYPLPPLREDIAIFPGARTARGEKSWVLHDPLRNRYFHIGESELVLLGLWAKCREASLLAEAASSEGMAVDLEEVIAFAEFLGHSELLQPAQGSTGRFSALEKSRQRSWWEDLLHGYLFFKIPLIRPDKLLDRVYPRVRPLLSQRFALITALVGFISFFFVVRQWDIFLATFLGFLSWEGAFSFAVALALVKVFHEAGHAIACRHFGLRVPSVGVAFIVMWPVMYTDASEAWRLTSRRTRLAISSAGMMVELSIACYASFLWVVLPDGLLRSVMFTLATTTWITSLAVNLNPLMRFDGYYIFSDLFNIPNLQARSFSLARNRLRHILFGVPLIGDPGLPPREQYIAIAWAYATWIYRFFLFLGIAFLVYHFFFKALGILLFLVEIWWFLVGPIWREMKGWRELLPAMQARRRQAWGIGLLLLLLLLLIPWHSSFRVPALMRAGELQHLYPAEHARLLSLHVSNGQQVRAGDLMMELESPELDADIAAAVVGLRRAEYDLNRVLASTLTAGDRLVAEGALGRAQATLASLGGRRQRLRVIAPFDGLLMDVPVSLRPGLWIGGKQALGVLIGKDGGLVVDAYVPEDYLRFVHKGGAVRFYPEDVTAAVQHGLVMEVDAIDTPQLPDPYLAEVFGGGIPVRMTSEGAVPEHAVYRVRIRIDAPMDGSPMRVLRGWAKLEGDSRSLLQRGSSFIVGVLLRESGF